jgi:hypothetical protein
MGQKKFDSVHEEYFEWWLDEAKRGGFVKSYERAESVILIQKAEYEYQEQLKTKTTTKTKHLFHEHTYQPDYIVKWTKEGKKLYDTIGKKPTGKQFIAQVGDDDIFFSVVDIKPDKIFKIAASTLFTFPINQKLMYSLQGIYVNKVMLYPSTNSTRNINSFLFPSTWTPKKFEEEKRYKVTRPGKFTKGDSMIKFYVRSLEQFKSS